MLEYAQISEIGGRQVNEDSIGIAKAGNRYCFVVCDGLGGHGMGDVASQLVRDVFVTNLSETEDLRAYVQRSFTKAQNQLLNMQTKCGAKNRMKTTATVLAIDGNHICVGQIGDSRLYIFNENEIVYRTIDHSVPQMLAIAGRIKEEEIRHHPDRNKLLRAMGTAWEIPMFEMPEPLPQEQYQAFLLCSDGFWELIDENEMCTLLRKTTSANQWLHDMEKIVKKNKAAYDMDNYSAIAVMMDPI